MIHIKQILERQLINTRKAKLFNHNKDIFLKYFDSIEQYNALIVAGNFKKMEQIIAKNTNFTMSIAEETINNLK